MNTLTVLDGTSPGTYKLGSDVQQLRARILDTGLPLPERLAACRDIIRLEVGDTPLIRARHLERQHDLRQLYIKFEGSNPTGTQKDRIASAQVYDALRRGYHTVVAATCGNYGVAVAYACYLAGVACKVYIPANYHTERAAEMEQLGAEVLYLKGSYEAVVTASSELARKYHYYDANPGGDNTALQLSAYADIADEIYDQLRDAPRYLSSPVSNGTLLAGVYQGFVQLYQRGKTSRIPQLVAGSSTYKNPIVHSFVRQHNHIQDLSPDHIRETKTNEPLINWHSFDGEVALQALRNTDGYAAHISDRAMRSMSSFLSRHDGLQALPAATAGLLALLRLHEQHPLPDDRHVCLITARK